MKAFRQLRANVGVLAQARRHRLDLVRALVRRPQLLIGVGLYEVAIALSARVDPRLKILAELKVAALVACEHCLDIGSLLARGTGVTERQLRELHIFRTSDAFDDDERLVIEVAEALSVVPATLSDDLRARLAARFSTAERTELAATIAWENQRARLNQALGVRPSGFSDGRFCALPETAVSSVSAAT